MNPQPLSGESDIKNFLIKSDAGGSGNPSQAIVPVIAQDLKSGHFRFVGTAFFIMHNGLIITAKHVLDDVRKNGKVVGPIAIIHTLENKKFFIRNIIKSYEFSNSDVAIALLDQPKHKTTGEPLLNKVLSIDFNKLYSGDRIFTCAHPKTSININEDQCTIGIEPSIFEGNLVTEFPKGRDSVMLPNPCWQTDMHIHGGASGGPVFNERGHVIGINCTSSQFDPSFSFVSTLEHIQDINVKGLSIPDKDMLDPTIRELIESGLISKSGNIPPQSDKLIFST